MKKCCTAAVTALLAMTIFAGCYSAEEKEVYTTGDLTDDGEYVETTFYRKEYEGPIEFSVYMEK